MSGKKFDQGKPDMALIPVAAAIEEAHLWGDGKKKYSAYNWYAGIMYMRILSAMERHMYLLKAGIDFDYETKRHHGAAIRCGAAMLIQFSLEQRTHLDDRMPMSDEIKQKIESMAKGESIFDILNETSINNSNLCDTTTEDQNGYIPVTENDFEDVFSWTYKTMVNKCSDSTNSYDRITEEQSMKQLYETKIEDDSPYAKVAKGIAKFNKEKT